MNQDKDFSGIQEEIHPSNLLDNAFWAFDTLPLKQKDIMIAQYKGKKQDFVGAWLDWY